MYQFMLDEVLLSVFILSLVVYTILALFTDMRQAIVSVGKIVVAMAILTLGEKLILLVWPG